ncbi:hypothetical protein [Pedobacter agri]|uniref:hypothetical protein n=1 Tax=Pedobacter agri TaxID=454586 RepID=UPI00292E6DA7|nr:hypothetical protein [Pedobacter agri]
MQLSIPLSDHLVKSNLKVWSSDYEFFLNRLRNHDEAAFKELYHQYSGAIFGNIKRTVHDDLKSKQILERTFIEIWNSISSFDETRTRLFTWMNQIANKQKLISY